MNEKGNADDNCAVSVRADLTNREIGDGIARWLDNNPDASQEQRMRAYDAMLSCRNADRPDAQSDVCQRLHRQNLQAFVAAAGGV